MCGIAGILYADPLQPCAPETVNAMRDVMCHRGPDDAGTYVDGPLGLAHRRLSIIDLTSGHQPMASADESLWIVFNGEIYNYRELRERLRASGHRFRTNSDTEVILNLWAEAGEACVDTLNGMFAFALWDRRRRSLFLARDRMGVKPLYYAETPKAFVFGSEIKALLASGLLPTRYRGEALSEYLVFRDVAGEETLFEGVKSLAPGCTMVRADGIARTRRFWCPHPPRQRRATPSYAEACEELARLLEDSVRLRMISDVPLGTFCSGGVDSSLVTAIAAGLKGGPVNTYSIGFDEPDYDESRFAAAASQRYHTLHHELRVGNADFSDLLPRLIWHNDEPLNFANSIQIFALSRLAKEQVTVVLTGEGSDELFAGYPRYRIPGLARYYRSVPGILQRTIQRIARDHRLEKLARYSSLSFDDVLLFNASFVRPEAAAALCPDLPGLAPHYRVGRLHASRSLGLDEITRLSLLDQETYLLSILHRQDKMSMAASIESRVPFMDYRIVEFANSLPTSFKIRPGSGKRIVKDVARRFLPDEIVDRRKSGFGVPLDRWFRADTGMGERLMTVRDDSRIPDFVDRRQLRQLIDEHRSGTADHTEILWAVLNLSLWMEVYPARS